MQLKNAPQYKKNKLVIALILIALLIASYFVYKYTYILVERRKYDKATVAIQKVADDLRSEGIETKFSRGCSRNIEVYGKGSLTCDVNISYENDESTYSSKLFLKTIKYILDKNSFIKKSGTFRIEDTSPTSGISTYTYLNDQQFSLQYDKTYNNNNNYKVIFSFDKNSRFVLF